MAGAARKNCRTREFEQIFRIEDALHTMRSNQQRSLSSQGWRELATPAIVLGYMRCEFRFVYGADSAGHLKFDEGVGLYVYFQNPRGIKCSICYGIHFVNADASQSRGVASSSPKDIDASVYLGRSPSLDNRQPVPGLTLADLLDCDNGWLHEPARLHLRCKLSIETSICKAEDVYIPDATQEVCDSFKSFLDDEDFADVTLVVGDEVVKAHTQILAARSHVFRAMLKSGMRESREKEVKLPDLDATAVRQLLTFFYSGVVVKQALGSDESTISLLRAAHCFEAKTVVKRCVEALIGRLCVDSVSERLELADLLGCGEFKQACLRFMRPRMQEVQETDSYARLVQQRPSLLKDLVAAMVARKRRYPRESDEDDEPVMLFTGFTGRP